MPVDPRIQAALERPLMGKPSAAALPGAYAAAGYAAAPGTGPAGETCRSCRHVYERTTARTFWKCAVSSCQSKTKKGDVALRSPACSKWEKPE